MPPRPLWIVPAVMLAVALAPMPYGYYQLLRLVVAGAAAALAYLMWKGRSGSAWTWPLMLVALLYNPVFVVHLDRGTWNWINIATIGLFLFFGWREGRRAT